MKRRRERKLIYPLLRLVEGKTPDNIIELLWSKGLLDYLAVERLYIASEVERRVCCGESKMRAIEVVAYDIGCSYEKARAAVYRKD
ncbi:MAG: hypothetical protein IKV09_04300 [Alistipes sp.]|nr:hypothetical protein [Alistipes sp.]